MYLEEQNTNSAEAEKTQTDTQQRVLVVEDNKAWREDFKEALQNSGFIVDTAITGEDAEPQIRSKDYDLMLLDRLLDEKNVFSKFNTAERFVEHLDEIGLRNMPILIVSGFLRNYHNVEQLKKIGITDYLEKAELHNGNWAEVLVRKVNSTISDWDPNRDLRYISVKNHKLYFGTGNLYIDDDVSISFTETELGILKLLMENPRVVHPKEQIIRKVWGYQELPYDYSNRVTTHIRNVNKKYKTALDQDEGLMVHRGSGYILSFMASEIFG